MRFSFRVPFAPLSVLAPLFFTAALSAFATAISAQAGEAGAAKSLNAKRPAIFQSPRPSLILGEGDEIATLNAIQTALQTVGDGGAYVWQRPHGLLDGIIQPTTSFKGADGRVCRHLVIRLNSGAYSRQVEGIACRSGDGRWSLSG